MAVETLPTAQMTIDEFSAWRNGPNMPILLRHDPKLWPAPAWTPDDVDARWPELEVTGYVVANQRLDARPDQGLPTERVTWHAAVQRLSKGNVHVSNWLADLPSSLVAELWPPAYCAGQARLKQRLWLTAQGVVTGTHQDPYDNWYTILHGSKRFTVASPAARRWLQPYPLWSRLPNFGQRSLENMASEAPALWTQYHGSVVEVRAGDLLYLPRFWWHEVLATSDTVAVNAFAVSGWMVPVTTLAAAYRKLRNI
jgi:hypothetical protein